MSHEMICTWLGLPPDAWPPDHYRLLGLDLGESDVALIEQRVHQKLASVRPYQMMHPDQATEVMNRLAEAFVCLTEPATKTAYDRSLLGTRRVVPPPLPLPPVLPAGGSAVTPPALAVPRRDPLVWLYTPSTSGPPSAIPPPPPVRGQPPSLPPALPVPVERPAPPPPPPPLPPAPPPEPVDEVVEAAQPLRKLAEAWPPSAPCFSGWLEPGNCCACGTGPANTSRMPRNA